MKMRQSNLLAALLLLSAVAGAAPSRRIAILPFVSEVEGSTPGWDVSAELFSRWNGAAGLLSLDWDSLTRILDGERPSNDRLQDPAFLRRVGRRLSVDAVISGSYSETGGQAIVNAQMVDVETGKVSRTRKFLSHAVAVPQSPELAALEYAVLVDAPARAKAAPAPGSNPNEMIAMRDVPLPRYWTGTSRSDIQVMRDAVSDSPCAGAAKRVNRIEKGLMEVKAKYWALELRKGRASKGGFAAAAAMAGPAKKDFYSKLNHWSSKKDIPGLTRAEADRFADMETRASSLARRCEILK